MADTKTSNRQQSQQGGQALAHHDRPRRGLQRWDTPASPFELFDRMSEEMDRAFGRMFHEFGLPHRAWGRSALAAGGREGMWTPRIEAFQKGDRFIVRADLPGLKKDDVHVEMTDDALTIQGERHEEHEEEREGYYQSERDYGQFYRSIPLPDGVIAESAQATFRDGVLEVTMQAAPSEANRGRRLEIKDASSPNENQKK